MRIGRWSGACLMGLLLAISPALAQTLSIDALKTDARLQQPVSLSHPIVGLDALMPELSKLSDVSISVSEDVKDLKASLFIKQKPLCVVMDKLAKALDLSWQKSGSGSQSAYRLYQSSAQKERQQSLYRQERERNLLRLQAYVEVRKQLAKQPYEQILDAWKSIRKELEQEKLAIIQKYHTEDTLVYDSKEFLLRTYPPGAQVEPYVMGYLFNHLTREEEQAFWEGAPIVCSTLDPHTRDKLPAKLVEWKNLGTKETIELLKSASDVEHLTETIKRLEETRYDDYTVFYRYHPIKQVIEHYRYWGGGKHAENGSFPIESEPSDDGRQWVIRAPDREPKLVNVRLEAESLRHNPTLQAAITSETNLLHSQLPPSKHYHFGQLLAWVAARSSLNYIAEVTRQTAGYYERTTATKVIDWLMYYAHRFDISTEEDFVILRDWKFYRHRLTEAPERKLKPLEAKAQMQGGLTIDDWMDFVLDLTPEQLQNLHAYDALAASFTHHSEFARGIEAIRFWRSLTKEQQAQMRAKEGLRVSALTRKQVQSLIAILISPQRHYSSLSRQLRLMPQEEFNQALRPLVITSEEFLMEGFYADENDQVKASDNSISGLKQKLLQLPNVKRYTIQHWKFRDFALKFTLPDKEPLAVWFSTTLTNPYQLTGN